MDITITTTLKSRDRWDEKKYGVILIDNFDRADEVLRYLRRQDDYWRNRLYLIREKPLEIISEKTIQDLCDYTSKTSIYDMPKFMEAMRILGIGVFVYQYDKDCD